MANTVISIENVSKQYQLGIINTGTFRNDLKVWWARVQHKPNPLQKVDEDSHNNRDGDILWALRDISFDVQQGDALGIIGSNGAGKSTLLKILSRVTTPTYGQVKVKGRIASLLEVGTGFHPELTGRENVYLNGAIMGMNRAEVDRKFDEIVDFSGVEKFIDTPVKRYSSGMYVRLAFAVAAHLEPEILIVDEVLAVGDAEFQKKCLGKMGDVTHEGRTVLFVSHSMAAITNLCSRSIMLKQGKLAMSGNTNDVVSAYLAGLISNSSDNSLENSQHYGNGKARFTEIEINAIDEKGHNKQDIVTNDDLVITTKIMAYESIVETNAAVIIYDSSGYRLIDVNTALKNQYISLAAGEEIQLKFIINELRLKPGQYLVGLWIGRPSIEDIDGILYAKPLTVNVNPKNIMHSQVFPGPYQCEFSIHKKKSITK